MEFVNLQQSLRRRAQTAAERVRFWSRFFTRLSYPGDLPLVLHALRHHKIVALPPSVWALIEPVRGHLVREEAGLLYWAAREWPAPGPVVELGAFAGRSTIVLASAGRQVHSVDAWGAVPDPALKDVDLPGMFAQFQANLRRAQVADYVTVHRGSTWDVDQTWHTRSALLFVDAGHEYAAVKGDLERWCPWLLPDGLLLMHDTLGANFLGVTRAAAELLRGGWRVVASAGSLVAFTRP